MLVFDDKIMNDKDFEIIYTTYFKPLYFYALRIVLKEDVAEDIMQEVFMECWSRRKKLDTSSSLKSYLYKLTHNRSLDFLKSSANKKIDLSNEITTLDYLLYTAFTVDEQLHGEEIGREIDNCIASLPEKCKDVFLLSRQKNLKNREIAEQLGINLKTVEKHISKALQEIRAHLSETGYLFIAFLVWIIDLFAY